MREQHPDLLSFTTSVFVFWRSDLRAGDLARVFIDIARDFPRRHVGTTKRLEIAGGAVLPCRAIKARACGGDAGSRPGEVAAKLKQMLASGAGVTIGFGFEDEVRAREHAVGAVGFVEDGNMRRDLLLLDQPGEVFRRSIDRVGEREPGRRPNRSSVRSSMVWDAPTSACRTARVASTSTITP